MTKYVKRVSFKAKHYILSVFVFAPTSFGFYKQNKMLTCFLFLKYSFFLQWLVENAF